MVKSNNVLAIILGIIVVVSIISGVIGAVLSSFNELTPQDACEDEGCAFDNPAGFCAINSSTEGSGIACPTTPRSTSSLLAILVPVFSIIFAIGLFFGIKVMIKKLE